MAVRMNKAWDDGKIVAAAGDMVTAFTPLQELRLVRSGLAEAIDGEEGLAIARVAAGMPAIGFAAEPREPVSEAMYRRKLVAIAEERGITIESDDNKADIVRKINEAG